VTPRQLIEQARAQPEVAVMRDVSVPGPELAALLHSGRPLLVSALLEHPDQHRERRQYRYGHVLGPGLAHQGIRGWQDLHPESVLRDDVWDLLTQVDGVHLWADLETRRSYFGIRPLDEWRSTRDDDAGALFQEQPRDTLVLSYHENGDYFLLLHPGENRFVWYDPQSPGDSRTIGASVAELLDWWWDRAQELDPRSTGDRE